MSFINKESEVVINTKLTTLGRSLLANGKLNFSQFAIGDSEIDYNFIVKYNINPQDLKVLKPVDKNPEIKSFIKPSPSSTSYKVALNTPTPNSLAITSQTETRGFFTGSVDVGFALKTSTEYIKGTSLVAPSSINGGPNIQLQESVNGLAVNDYILIGWRLPDVGSEPVSPIGTIPVEPIQYIWYKVVHVAGTTVELDKNVPNIPSGSGRAYVFPSGQSLKYYYSKIDEREKSTPVWAFTIVYGRSMEGTPNSLRASSYPSSTFIGFKNYLQENKEDKALGIVHYTNYNMLNEYGESLFKDSFVLDLPTIMYHNSTATKLGVKLTSGPVVKTFSGGTTSEFETPYYDLLDEKGKVVGKVFIDFKLATIEDQELLAAMSMKSNRNWTLPDFSTFAHSSVETGEDLYMTYQFVTHDGESQYAAGSNMGLVTALHSQYIHKVDCKVLDYIDFTFDADGLKFMKDATSMNGTGFQAVKFYLLFQRVPKGTQPVHNQWTVYDYTPHLNNNGATISVSALTSKTFRISESMVSQGDNSVYNLNYLRPNKTANNLEPFTLKGFGTEDNGPAV